ncbi:LLM class F420-dependent oxidoreductase [Pilimelia terevasa]|uniref:LLM class F420-dependent oxidoreductase n=1 Tax=Pilimelia terevasa TaxID=53372 RepID=A0A8J3BV37_9ACTN|nr:LLM class F420-dependent oxidoreductase [Pilimelia terevasa]GGK42287.1 LLM class F420-dependent oxidoreductase [Pilimelia terevasa]
MRLGLNLGYQTSATDPTDQLAWVREAERLDYAVVWVAEAYGSDSPTVLAWLAGQTSRIDLGAAVMQIPARTPAATAMTAATLDNLSGGRFRLGLGVSGPQVSEGWHGVRFAAPLARTAEYVDIVRLALARREVAYAGTHYRLPLPDGPGKALRLSIRPRRPDLPIYLAAVGPRNLELAGRVADGWLGIFCAADALGESLDPVRAGRAAAGRRTPFDVVAAVPVVPAADDAPATLARCADAVRPYAALYIGGMGSRGRNFYHALAGRLGYAAAADEVQRRYLAGQPREAAAAVPQEFIDRTSLLGSTARIAAGLRAYAAAGVSTLSVNLGAADREAGLRTLRTVAEARRLAGLDTDDDTTPHGV